MAIGERKVGQDRGLLSPAEVARLLGLSRAHVYTLAASGQLPSVKFGRAVRFDRRDVEEFVREHRRRAESSAFRKAQVGDPHEAMAVASGETLRVSRGAEEGPTTREVRTPTGTGTTRPAGRRRKPKTGKEG